MSLERSSSTAGREDLFATTRWTVVLAAGATPSEHSERALDELCRAYWYPLYAYVRRRGHLKEEAEDLTQTFFERFLLKNYLEGLNAELGRFRAFLLASLKHFLANEWDKKRALKRGGDSAHLSLDWKTADEQFQVADQETVSPDKAFDREWAMALLGKVIERIQAEFVKEGRGTLFEQLKGSLIAGGHGMAYAEVAAKLGMQEGAVRVAAHRLRKRYRALLREEIAHTLSESASVEEELRALFGAFG